MRAPYSILIALAVAGSTLPASGTAFWQKHNPRSVSASPMPQAGDQVSFDLLAQARPANPGAVPQSSGGQQFKLNGPGPHKGDWSVSYTHLRAHETDSYLVCRLLLEKKK